MENNNTNNVSDNNNEEIKRQKGFATASLVCGIVGTVLICTVYGTVLLGILAIVFGIIALSKRKKTNSDDGKGRAIAGIIIGAISLVLVVLVVIGAIAYLGSDMYDLDLY